MSFAYSGPYETHTRHMLTQSSHVECCVVGLKWRTLLLYQVQNLVAFCSNIHDPQVKTYNSKLHAQHSLT